MDRPLTLSDWRVTAGIAALTLVVSGAVIAGGLLGPVAFGWGFIPAVASGAAALPPEVSALPAWATPLSATLAHAGWAHLVINLVVLGFCGSRVERPLGGVGVAILYVAGAYAAALGDFIQAPAAVVPAIGASGATAALVGAFALLYGQRRAGMSEAAHVLWLGAAWVGIQLLVALAGMGGGTRVPIGAHIGGFVVGLALARPLLRWRYRRA